MRFNCSAISIWYQSISLKGSANGFYCCTIVQNMLMFQWLSNCETTISKSTGGQNSYWLRVEHSESPIRWIVLCWLASPVVPRQPKKRPFPKESTSQDLLCHQCGTSNLTIISCHRGTSRLPLGTKLITNGPLKQTNKNTTSRLSTVTRGCRHSSLEATQVVGWCLPVAKLLVYWVNSRYHGIRRNQTRRFFSVSKVLVWWNLLRLSLHDQPVVEGKRRAIMHPQMYQKMVFQIEHSSVVDFCFNMFNAWRP